MAHKPGTSYDESNDTSPSRKAEELTLEAGGHVEDNQRSRRLVRAMDLRIHLTSLRLDLPPQLLGPRQHRQQQSAERRNARRPAPEHRYGRYQNFPTVVVLRFLIGAFEAGFFPGIVYLSTFWYPVEERSVRIAVVLASATVSGAFGGCIAYGIGYLNGSAGLEGFRWLLIIEGIITVASVALVVFFLPDWPARAKRLTDEDKKYIDDRIAVKGGGYTKRHATEKEIWETAGPCLTGLGFDSIKAQLMTVPPWVVGYFFSLFLGWSADRHNARGLHIACSSLLGGIGWVTAGSLPADAYTQRYGMLFVCACGAFPSSGPLSAWVTCNVPAFATMFIATACNNSTAGFSQVIAQWIWIPDEAESGYATGNYVCAACSFATAAIALGLRAWSGRLTKTQAKDAIGNQRIWLL